MGNLTVTSTWEPDIYKIETTDPVAGGNPSRVPLQGINNLAPQELANRTLWLKDRLGGFGGNAAAKTNLNTIATTGHFEFAGGATGNPLAGQAGAVIHTQLSDPLASQVAYLANGDVAQRFRDGTDTWSAWSFFASGAKSAFVHANSGYEIMPSGLILQWGDYQMSPAGITTPWVLAFPNNCLNAVGSDNVDGTQNAVGISFTATTVTLHGESSGQGNGRVLAIGH